MTGQRHSPRALGAPGMADGTYGLGVENELVTGYEPVVAGLTSADGSVTIDPNGDGTLDLSASGGGTKTAVFKVSGTLVTGAGATRLYNDTGAAWTIASIRASVETAPSGGSVVIDVNKNGTTLFTTQANRPTITSTNTTSGKVTAIDVTSVSDGDYLTVDIDTTTAPAANLTVIVTFS